MRPQGGEPPLASADASDGVWLRALIRVAGAAGAVANFCDHMEHCEESDRASVVAASGVLLEEADQIAASQGLNLADRYQTRVAAIETRSPLHPIDGFDVCARVAAATSWLDLQGVQARHDRLYHADVVGLHKQDQLRHCALHLAKLVAALASALDSRTERADFIDRRLADLVIFSLKIATLTGTKLGSDGLPNVPLYRPE